MSLICMEAFSPLSVTTRAFTPSVYRPVKNTSISFPLILATVTGTFSSASFAASFFASSSSRNKNTSSSKVSSSHTTYGSLVHREIRAKISASCPRRIRSSFLMAVIVFGVSLIPVLISFATLMFSCNFQKNICFIGYDCTTFPERTQSPGLFILQKPLTYPYIHLNSGN